MASERQVLTKIVLPAALPFIMAGMRLAIGRALVMVVVAEIYASNRGLGYLIFQAGGMYDTAQVFVGVGILAAAGVTLDGGSARARAPVRAVASMRGNPDSDRDDRSRATSRTAMPAATAPAPIGRCATSRFRSSPAPSCRCLGPSGCGKTTLLRIIDGLIQPSRGEILIDGKRVTGPSADRAMVFQEFNLLPWRTARSNIELPLEVLGVAAARRREISARSRWRRWVWRNSPASIRTSSPAA